ncbi:hypothetical protein, variant 3 [Aphanomyces invadans]|uniref:Elongation of fatty acids protein n=1 Tax=Aphanomyces invadans TaxID=157072 RepID=A0A024UL66_9STRA|nr:hypothetical protein, variant 2 [Aphanomyces invadans]XP_008865120.1 hypothetical protein, variant 3 [Aphanomyces invadans]ETW07044.1 hypothetical protein, variant 2 [Aphanomyces invadans]ETW07045.1 hypothetical protein, variant 3 [Aphanomyces invadans]|eukprot:XP_008865119.1 hypothetical protein, variant 2 [Aphanomyces invadans]
MDEVHAATAAVAERTLYLHEFYPCLAPLYPFAFENSFMLTWEAQFCRSTMYMCMALCAAYGFSCYVGKKFMRSREAFDLTPALALWNLTLSVFSACGALRTVPFLVHSIYHHGVYHSVCSDATLHYGNGPVGFWVSLFIFSKIPELFDTFFVVIRKKPLRFLHCGLYFVAMNYTVHAVMYMYYFLTALGYRPRWAYVVTMLQMSQMVVGVAVCVANVIFLSTSSSPSSAVCHASHSNLLFGVVMYASYFALFLHFFIQRYSTSPVHEQSKKEQ